jgi:formylglycine-generating enzyme required for sulfatase activity
MSDTPREAGRLRAEFHQAVGMWLEEQPHPPAEMYDSLWRTGPCALLRYAQSLTTAMPDDDRRKLELLTGDEMVEQLTKHAEFFLKHLHLYPEQDPTNPKAYVEAKRKADFLVRQLVNLVRGLASAVLAADTLRASEWTPERANLTPKSPLPEQFVPHAIVAMAAFHAAWPIRYEQRVVDSAGHAFQSNVPNARSKPSHLALDSLRLAGNDKPDVTAWLMLRRTLGYLLEHKSIEPSARRPPPARILLVEQSGNGRVGTVQVLPINEGQFGLYIDPVDTGILLLDEELLASLSLGWRCCSNSLRNNIARPDDLPSLTLRLSPQVERCLVLGGESAGGMMLMAMYAAAEKKSLDETTTASFSLQRSQPGADDEFRPLGLGDIEPGAVADRSVEAKVRAARNAGCRRVLFFSGQQLSVNGPDLAVWKSAVESQDGKPLEVVGIRSLEEAYRRLTENARLEEVLRKYASSVTEEWECKRPKPFIEPHYARLCDEVELRDSSQRLRQSGDEKQPGAREPLLDEDTRNGITLRPEVQTEVGNLEIGKLFQLARDEVDERTGKATTGAHGIRLLLAEDANAGKSVFTWRLMHYFADPNQAAGTSVFYKGQPVLVHRWENREGSRDWPYGDTVEAAERMLRADLKHAVAGSCEGTTATPDEVVDYALKAGRMVLIFDAADQTRHDLSGLFALLSTSSVWRQCHIIVTGRSFWFNQESGRRHFPKGSWTRTTLLGFDENQKARYLDDVLPPELRARREVADVVGDEHERLFLNYRDIRELLEVPGMIQMARKLVEDERRRLGRQFVQLGQLRTRCDFYWRYYHQEILGKAVADRSPGVDAKNNKERWQMMLAVTAFRMVLERLTGYSARGDLLASIKSDVIRYCEVLAPGDWKSADADRHWEEVAKFSALSDHGALEPDLDPDSLSWRHKGWMEYFLAVFLAKYADPKALRAFDFDTIQPKVESDDLDRPGYQPIDATSIADDAELFRAVLMQITNDPQWYWGWRMASEIPRVPVAGNDKAPLHNRRLIHSLGTLFLPPARGIRPTELMYFAFYLFEQDDVTPKDWKGYSEKLLGKQEVLAEFRRPMRELLKRAADESQFSEDARRKREVARTMTVESFMPCPPANWIKEFEDKQKERALAGRPLVGEELWDADPCVFWQDSPEGVGSDDERRRHRVQIRPFGMQQTTVTRAQYRLFDERLEGSSEESSWGYVIQEQVEKYAGDDADRKILGDDCPIIMINWFDAFMFAKFLGPEYRLPTESEWEFACRAGKDGPYDLFYFGKAPTSEQANFAYSGIRRPVPMQFKKFPKNDFQLDQMHGNVWEWTGDWIDEAYYGSLPCPEKPRESPTGPSAGSSRVLRGGSFRDSLVGCRAALRCGNAPAFRHRAIGFRLVIVSGVLRPSPSSVCTLSL